MTSRGSMAALWALGGLSACAEPPSYELRWAVGDQVPSVAACADRGLFQVRVRAYTAPHVFADERSYPCFPEGLADGGVVGGSPLPPGSYAIELRGLDRADEPWDDQLVPNPDAPVHNGCTPPLSADDVPECRPNERVCDCQWLVVQGEGVALPDDGFTVVAPEGETAPTPLDFTIDPPAQCEDGIDNDLDGRVDEGDPACVIDMSNDESAPVGVTDFELSITLLGANPVALCNSVPQFGRVQLRLEPDPTADEPEAEPTVLLDEPCQLDAPYRFSALLSPGLATFSVVGIDSRDGQVSTHPVTFQRELSPEGNLVEQSVDFDPGDFLEPIEGRMLFSIGYAMGLGTVKVDNSDNRLPLAPRSSCDPIPTVGGRLSIDGWRLTMLDGHGDLVEPPVRVEDGTPLDGSVVIPCQSANLITETLDWTEGYLLRAEALSAEGEVCFAIDDQPMRPGEALPVVLPRVFDEAGQVPASCFDCRVDPSGADTFDDCNVDPGDDARCIAGVCQYPCLLDEHCGPDLYGDDFVCAPPPAGELAYCAFDGSSG